MYTYSEGLEVINGEFIAAKMEDSILKHASMAVAWGQSGFILGNLQPLKSRIRMDLMTGDLREDKSVPVDPFGILGVVVHDPVEQNMGSWGQTPRTWYKLPSFEILPRALQNLHRGAWMARVGLECGIDLAKESVLIRIM